MTAVIITDTEELDTVLGRTQAAARALRDENPFAIPRRVDGVLEQGTKP